MTASVPRPLAAGAAALLASAVVLTSSPTDLVQVDTARTERVDLAAAVRPLVTEPPVVEPLTPARVADARALIARVDPDADVPAALAVAAPLNAASDWFTAGYEWLQGWVDYGVDLADYVLQFVPYGYLLGDQISLVYYTTVVPIADSIVYGLIDPALDDPLNLATWVNGFAVVATTTVASLINLGIAEFNYFFGWLIPPIPPIGPLAAPEVLAVPEAALVPAARLAASETAVVEEDLGDAVAPAADEVTAGPVNEVTSVPVADEPEASAVEPVAVEIAAADVTAPEVEPAASEATVDAPREPTTTSSGGVQAQGEVRGSVTAPDDTTTGAAAGGTTPAGTTSSTGGGSLVEPSTTTTGSSSTTGSFDTASPLGTASPAEAATPPARATDGAAESTD
ncbi:hypothetical protein [Mycolicibacterium grossiae]|uniref:PE family protein n=1 Tax=Mycolicibacterium grossiae TaxID=1552759 RepID=A0A1E8Q0J3_9MYCO|nr:hypothetical protein [Mycolicibacterium grossiae]OFJ52032.1 hypothetical protein BEL07_19485 [Mycolicibacterium grossiae]QEM47758.1 hypothetical protein FZ046_26040 [Mycolicibacterium grossiae]